jgi:hypothetical protein
MERASGRLPRRASGLAVGGRVLPEPDQHDPLDEYSGLFAEKGGFDIPQTFTGGWPCSPRRANVALDVQWINYESIKSVGNDFLPNLALAALGVENGAGFGWHDMTVYKAGVQFEASEKWTLRGGYSYGRQPIRSNEVLINILAPGVMEQHVSAGVTRLVRKGRPSTSPSSAPFRRRSAVRTTWRFEPTVHR